MAVDKLAESRLRKLGDGKHSDGGGLYLYVRGTSRIWTFRYTDRATKKRGEISFGTYPELTLAAARQRRQEARNTVAAGEDPRQVKDAPADRSVRAVIDRTFAAISPDLKGGGNAGRWMSPVRMHVLPALGGKDITKLTAADVRNAMAPVWRTRPSASQKALDRLGIALKHAAAEYPGEVDAGVIASARILLGSQGHKPVNIPSMPWREVPAFYATLGETPVELALRLTILTASRSGPVRLARAEQIEGDTWVIPGENMKGGEAFRIPLSEEAQRVISLLRDRDGWLFHGAPRGPSSRPPVITDMTMTRHLDRAGVGYRPHGFRSSFRVWAEETGEDWTLAETALDHSVGNKVQRAYQRSDLLEQRRPLMERWAALVTKR